MWFEDQEHSLLQVTRFQHDTILVPTLIVCGVVVGVLVVLLGVYRVWAVGRSRENLSRLGGDVEALHDKDYEVRSWLLDVRNPLVVGGGGGGGVHRVQSWMTLLSDEGAMASCLEPVVQHHAPPHLSTVRFAGHVCIQYYGIFFTDA